MKSKISKSKLVNLLLKRANGFFYNEEIYEYEKPQKINNLKQNYIDNNKFYKNNVTPNTQLSIFNDTINLENEKTKNISGEEVTLVKKKVSTHYIAPDIQAIKILLEIYKEEVNNDTLENLSDEELLKIQNTLIEELINDNRKNN